MNWRASLQLASVYVGTVVGAGFATGREIVEFFSRYGLFGLGGILISGLCFIAFGVKIMKLAIRLKAGSFHQLNVHMYGPYITPVINLLMFIMLLGVTAVMLSGAGSVFSEQLHLPKIFGILLTMILALITLTIGTKGLVYVNSLVVPLLIAFSFMLAVLSFRTDGFIDNVLWAPDFEWGSFTSAFAYAAFNIMLTSAVLVPAANEIGDERVVKTGGILGGLALTIILIFSHVTLVQLPSLQSYHIPMAVMMNRLAGSLYFLYIIIIYGEIFTSVVGNIYGLERFIRKKVHVHSFVAGLFLFSIAFMFSLIDYGTLLSLLYPLFGYISLFFLVLLLIR